MITKCFSAAFMAVFIWPVGSWRGRFSLSTAFGASYIGKPISRFPSAIYAVWTLKPYFPQSGSESFYISSFPAVFFFFARFAIAVLSSEVLLKSIFTSRWESGFCGIIPPTSQRRLNSHTAAYSLCRYRNRSGKTIFAIINNRSVIKDIVISYVK